VKCSVCIIVECFQGKTRQILDNSVLTGVRDIFKMFADQPKGRPGLISRADKEGKGKGKDIYTIMLHRYGH